MWRVLTTFGPKMASSDQVVDHLPPRPPPRPQQQQQQQLDCECAPRPAMGVHWPRTSTLKHERKHPQPQQIIDLPQSDVASKNDDYKLLRLLGSGGFGEAYLARRRTGKTSTTVVIKRMRASDHGGKRLIWARREAEIMAALYHANVVRFYHSFEENNQVVLEMEYCDGGDLRHFLRSRNGQLLTEKQIRVWFSQIVSAVAFIHDQNIIHRDIKSKNIFLHDAGRIVKLGDFGAAKCLIDKRTNEVQLARTRVGTCSHHPPEFCRKPRREYGTEVDIWSLGVLLFEMTTLRMPFEAKSEKEMTAKILRGFRDHQIPRAVYSSALKQLVDVLMSPDPEDRPSAREIQSDRFLQTYRRYLRRSRRSSRSSRDSGHCSRPPHHQLKDQLLLGVSSTPPAPRHNTTGDPFFCLLSTQPIAGAANFVPRRLGAVSPPVWRQPFSNLLKQTSRGL